jgi:Uma2 family endonuclease
MPLDLLELAMPIAVRPAAPVTDEELMRFSSVNQADRIEQNKEGEITITSPSGGIGANHEYLIMAALARWMDQGHGGKPFSSTAGFNLPDGSCLSPDGAWISADRWSALPHERQRGFPPLCPDFLVEVRSSTDRRKPLEEKMQLWMQNGAKLAWLVDPIEASVTIYRTGEPEQKLMRPERIEGDGLMTGLVLETSEFWDTL